TPPLTEEQLFTLPMPKQQRPEDVVAPWIVEATRLHRLRHPEQPTDAEQTDAQSPPVHTHAAAAHPTAAQPTTPYPTRDWSQATTVDLTGARQTDGRIPNPMAPAETSP